MLSLHLFIVAKNKQLQSKSWLEEVLYPTHRGEAAMGGAPDRLWWFARVQGQQQRQPQVLRLVLRTSLRMTRLWS
jgi:hypothetical protein